MTRVDLETVGWVDVGGWPAACPRCLPGGIARAPHLFDMRPVTAYEAGVERVQCATCNERLIAAPETGAEAMAESEASW